MNAIQALIEQPASEQLQHEQATDRLRHEEVVSSRLTEVQLSMARMLSNIDQNQPSPIIFIIIKFNNL